VQFDDTRFNITSAQMLRLHRPDGMRGIT